MRTGLEPGMKKLLGKANAMAQVTDDITITPGSDNPRKIELLVGEKETPMARDEMRDG